MSTASRNSMLALFVIALLAPGAYIWWNQRQRPADMTKVIELNNRGIGAMEQFDYPKAQTAFEEATKLAPTWLPGRINLGIALLNQNEAASLARAVSIFEGVLREDKDNNHADFCLAIILWHQGRDAEKAVAHFEAVTRRDPHDPHTWFFLGNLLNQSDQRKRARECYEKALAADPYLPGVLNALQLLYRQEGNDKAAQDIMQRMIDLNKAEWRSHADKKYAEMGKYAEVIGRNLPGRLPGVGPLPIFVRDDKFNVELATGTRWATPKDLGDGPEGDLRRAVRQRFGGTIVVLDFNADGKLDLFLAGAAVRGGKLGDVLLVNRGDSRFKDTTEEAGLATAASSLGCCVADFDNDGAPDLLLTGIQGVCLWRNTGDGAQQRFEDVTKKASLDQLTGVCLGAAFVDLDQDSDLDLVVTQYAPDAPRALAAIHNKAREADDGRVAVFLNVGEAPPNPTPEKPLPLTTKFERSDKLIPGVHTTPCNVAVSDLDGDRDIDLLIFSDGPPAAAVLNDRLLKFHRKDWFKEITTLHRSTNGAAILDVNRDERSDLLLVGPGEKATLLIQGKPGEAWFTAGVTNAPALLQAQAVDVDLDGWTDVIGLSAERAPVLLHNEAGKLVHVKEGLGAGFDWPKVAGILAADFDNRCRVDFVIWPDEEGPRLYRNQGNGNRALPVVLTGRRERNSELRTNSDGIGARVAAQAGAHFTCAERATFSAGLGQSRQPLLLGLGKADHADFVSIRWPDGIWQAELNVVACQHAVLRETNRKTVSCPLLFAWNGKQFEYITDFLGAGSIGEPLPQGGHRRPRAEESVKIEPDQLALKEGKYVIKIAEPMDEVTYLDRLRLVVVDHPADLGVYPDERFPIGSREATQDLLVFSGAQQVFPKMARDHRGRDVTDTLRRWDRRTADGFAKRSWIGFAEEHWVELDFGDGLAKWGAKEPLGLFLAGWTDYPYPESNWAASQAKHELLPPVLERLGDDGRWRVLREDLSFPAGLPRMMTCDVTGLVGSPACKLRIRTNMHVYWDQVFVAPLRERVPCDRESAATVRMHALDVHRATLEHRGCVQEFSPDGQAPTVYAHDRLENAPVTRMAGALTKLGDVTELLGRDDDRFVIIGPGDEATVTFAGESLPALPEGWKRSFVLRTWGYCKDASPWTATGGTIEPLPFRGMSSFPYGPNERHPHEEYRRKWNSR